MDEIWENIKSVEVTLPLDVVKEFSDSFNKTFEGKCEMQLIKQNQNVISAYVGQPTGPRQNVKTEIFLKIVAPMLNGYTLSILSVVYDMSTVYPCRLTDDLNSKLYVCGSSQELHDRIVEIIKSEKFVKSASMILTQVNKESERSFEG